MNEFHSASGTFTSIDLNLCSPSLFLDFSWNVVPTLVAVTTFPSCWRTMDLLLSPSWIPKHWSNLWNRIRKIKGKESSNSIHHLSANDRDVTSHCDIANALADNFLIIRLLLSAQMLLHLYAVKLKSRILTFHLKMLRYTIGSSL